MVISQEEAQQMLDDFETPPPGRFVKGGPNEWKPSADYVPSPRATFAYDYGPEDFVGTNKVFAPMQQSVHYDPWQIPEYMKTQPTKEPEFQEGTRPPSMDEDPIELYNRLHPSQEISAEDKPYNQFDRLGFEQNQLDISQLQQPTIRNTPESLQLETSSGNFSGGEQGRSSSNYYYQGWYDLSEQEQSLAPPTIQSAPIEVKDRWAQQQTPESISNIPQPNIVTTQNQQQEEQYPVERIPQTSFDPRYDAYFNDIPAPGVEYPQMQKYNPLEDPSSEWYGYTPEMLVEEYKKYGHYDDPQAARGFGELYDKYIAPPEEQRDMTPYEMKEAYKDMSTYGASPQKSIHDMVRNVADWSNTPVERPKDMIDVYEINVSRYEDYKGFTDSNGKQWKPPILMTPEEYQGYLDQGMPDVAELRWIRDSDYHNILGIAGDSWETITRTLGDTRSDLAAANAIHIWTRKDGTTFNDNDIVRDDNGRLHFAFILPDGSFVTEYDLINSNDIGNGFFLTMNNKVLPNTLWETNYFNQPENLYYTLKDGRFIQMDEELERTGQANPGILNLGYEGAQMPWEKEGSMGQFIPAAVDMGLGSATYTNPATNLLGMILETPLAYSGLDRWGYNPITHTYPAKTLTNSQRLGATLSPVADRMIGFKLSHMTPGGISAYTEKQAAKKMEQELLRREFGAWEKSGNTFDRFTASAPAQFMKNVGHGAGINIPPAYTNLLAQEGFSHYGDNYDPKTGEYLPTTPLERAINLGFVTPGKGAAGGATLAGLMGLPGSIASGIRNRPTPTQYVEQQKQSMQPDYTAEQLDTILADLINEVD